MPAPLSGQALRWSTSLGILLSKIPSKTVIFCTKVREITSFGVEKVGFWCSRK